MSTIPPDDLIADVEAAQQLKERLWRATESYERAQRYFAGFCDEARRCADLGKSVKGPKVTVGSSMLGMKFPGRDILVVKFLDREIHIILRTYGGASIRGALTIDDVSATVERERPLRVARIVFDANTGVTELGRETGGNIDLSVPGDCQTLFYHCLDLALRADPWGAVRQ